MSDYKVIKGKTVLSVSSDLGAEGEGEIWFNTTSNDFKTIVKVAGSWSSGGDLNDAKSLQGSGAGIQTAGVVWGGQPGTTVNCEEYDGSSWTEVNNIPTATKQVTGIGTQTAALSCGGSGDIDSTYEYDGTNWADGGGLPAPSAGVTAAGFGTQTAAIRAGGGDDGINNVYSTTASYNGTAWTQLSTLSGAARYGFGGAGTTTAGLVFAGRNSDSTILDIVEEYDGSSWSEVSDLNSGRIYCGIGQGTQVDALCVGGGGGLANTEIYDGTSWTEVGDLSTGRNTLAQSSGTTNTASGFGAGGYASGYSDATEEWNWSSTVTGPGAQNIKIITD